MSNHLSGVDAIAPAIERAKKQLLTPFRFKHWLRLSVVCFLTGEITGGGGGNGLQGLNYRLPPPPHDGTGNSFLAAQPDWMSKIPLEIIGWVALAAVAVVLLLLVLFYISSVFRFILFDSVLNNRCEIGEGWRRWQRQGSSYFLWQISFGLATFGAIGIVLGIPVLLAWQAGMFTNPDQHIVALIIGGFILFFLFVAIMIVSAIGALFAKDFVVPVMAIEGHGVLEGWRRVLPMVGQEKGAYAFYVLMKIVLAIGSAILFGILEFMIVFALLIPIGLAGIVVFFLAKGAGMTWNPLTIGLTVAAGCIVLLLLVAVTAFISTPAMVFFQAYSMHFFGSRYPALGAALSPPDAPPPALAPLPNPLPVT